MGLFDNKLVECRNISVPRLGKYNPMIKVGTFQGITNVFVAYVALLELRIYKFDFGVSRILDTFKPTWPLVEIYCSLLQYLIIYISWFFLLIYN